MYLIVGLGNPEEDYSNTRHNMGFNAINKLSEKYEIQVNKKKFNGLYGTGIIENDKVILLKPQTYMNLSGDSIIEFVNFYKIPLKNILVIYDDIDLGLGVVKIRKKGGAGTHNGMKSVVEKLSSTDFPRVRIGIGMPEHKGDLANYVLGHIPDDEKEVLNKATIIAKDAITEIIKNGIDNAMNKIN